MTWTDGTMTTTQLAGIAMANRIDVQSTKMRELTEYVARHGISHPLQVEDTNRGLLLTDGHHRLLAALAAGLTILPVRIYANTAEGRTAANRAMTVTEVHGYCIATSHKH